MQQDARGIPDTTVGLIRRLSFLPLFEDKIGNSQQYNEDKNNESGTIQGGAQPINLSSGAGESYTVTLEFFHE